MDTTCLFGVRLFQYQKLLLSAPELRRGLRTGSCPRCSNNDNNTNDDKLVLVLVLGEIPMKFW